MRIKHIGISAYPGECNLIMHELGNLWSSISLSEKTISTVLEMLTANGNLDEIVFRMVQTKLVLSYDRNAQGKYLQYEIGWKSGLRFARFTAPNTDRDVLFLGRDNRDGAYWVDVHINFGPTGSRNQAGSLLRALAPLEQRLKNLTVSTTRGPMRPTESVISTALEEICKTLQGEVTYFNRNSGTGIIEIVFPVGEKEQFYLHSRNVSDRDLVVQLERTIPGKPAIGNRVCVEFTDGGRVLGKKNRLALDIQLAR